MYFTKHVMAIHFAISISFVNQYFLVSCRMDEVFIGTRVCVCIVSRSQDVDNDNQHRHYICDDGMLEQQCNKNFLYAIASWIYFFTFFPRWLRSEIRRNTLWNLLKFINKDTNIIVVSLSLTYYLPVLS